jgi:hypothetical protein
VRHSAVNWTTAVTLCRRGARTFLEDLRDGKQTEPSGRAPQRKTFPGEGKQNTASTQTIRRLNMLFSRTSYYTDGKLRQAASIPASEATDLHIPPPQARTVLERMEHTESQRLFTLTRLQRLQLIACMFHPLLLHLPTISILPKTRYSDCSLHGVLHPPKAANPFLQTNWRVTTLSVSPQM